MFRGLIECDLEFACLTASILRNLMRCHMRSQQLLSTNRKPHRSDEQQLTRLRVIARLFEGQEQWLRYPQPTTSRAMTYTSPIKSWARVRSISCSYRALCQTSRQFGNRRIEADFFGVSPPSVTSSFSTSVALECPIGALRFSRLNEVGSDRAALFGISEGGPMSLLYAATYPERTSALVLYGTYAKRSWSPDLRSTTRTLTRCDGAAPTSRCPSTAKAVRWTAFSIRPDVAF
jgi:hypothetical protein